MNLYPDLHFSTGMLTHVTLFQLLYLNISNKVEKPQLTRKQFTIVPAIFTPFSDLGIPVPDDLDDYEDYEEEPEPEPLPVTVKLQMIIDNLETQQQVVKGGMVSLVCERAETLKNIAQHQTFSDDPTESFVDNMGGEGGIEELRAGIEKAQKEQDLRSEVDDMFAFQRRPAQKGARPEEFQMDSSKVNVSQPPLSTRSPIYSPTERPPTSSEDITMANTEDWHPPAPKPTKSDIQSNLPTDLQTLINRATIQISAYDGHAKSVVGGYKAALERRRQREASPTPSATMSTSSADQVIANIHAMGKGRVGAVGVMGGQDDVRRLSNGMPIVGYETGKPVRVRETMEELARRGSDGR